MGIGSWWKTSLNSYSHLMRAKSSYGLESKRRIEGRIRLQEDRTMQHSKRNSETVIEMTGGADLLERRRVAKDLAWKAKWGTRTAKLNRKAERYRYLFWITQLSSLR
jgi:hypothetical protein